MVAEQEIKKTLNGNSGVKAPVLRPNGEGLFSLIPLTQGKFAIVDKEDYKWLMQWKWHVAIRPGRIKNEIHNYHSHFYVR